MDLVEKLKEYFKITQRKDFRGLGKNQKKYDEIA
jgi:hypothetical protein